MPEIKLTAAEIAVPGPNLEPGELQCWLWRYLRDEFDDIAGGLQA